MSVHSQDHAAFASTPSPRAEPVPDIEANPRSPQQVPDAIWTYRCLCLVGSVYDLGHHVGLAVGDCEFGLLILRSAGTAEEGPTLDK